MIPCPYTLKVPGVERPLLGFRGPFSELRETILCKSGPVQSWEGVMSERANLCRRGKSRTGPRRLRALFRHEVIQPKWALSFLGGFSSRAGSSASGASLRSLDADEDPIEHMIPGQISLAIWSGAFCNAKAGKLR